ncbi:MAG: serine hydrolase domain-containing protein [Isosphaeraceae bacterium]
MPCPVRKRTAFSPSCEPLEGRAVLSAATLRSASRQAVVAESRRPDAARYEAAVRAVMAEYHVPGAVVGVWVPGRRGWSAATGVADVTTGRPISLGDRFPIRSITKSFTVTAVLQLARAGKLSLNDPISRYVAGIPNGGRITLAELAGMRSGVQNYTVSPIFLEQFVADLARPWMPREIVDTAIPGSPVFPPNARYNYSNTNTILLGMVVEQVTGRPLGAVFRSKIFRPLGLSQTDYPQAATIPSPHPTPYEVDPATGATEVIPPLNLSALGAAGGLVSSLRDLHRWGQALGTGKLIGPRLHRLSERRATPATDGPEYDAYGLGIGRLKGWWGHTGEALGFQAATFSNPKSGAVIAVALNSSQPTNVAAEIFKALADATRRH